MTAPIGQEATVMCPAPYTLSCLGFGALTLTSTAVLLSTISGGIPARARMAIISVETANARYRDDGTAPTASVGVQLVSGVAPFVYAGDLTAIQFVAVSGSPVINAAFYA
jgi:hypothetical protein